MWTKSDETEDNTQKWSAGPGQHWRFGFIIGRGVNKDKHHRWHGIVMHVRNGGR